MLMFQSNEASRIVKSMSHYDLLKQYVASVDTFFMNTFFLFSGIDFGEENDEKFTNAIMDRMAVVKKGMYLMRYYPQYQNRKFFDFIIEKCSLVHMMIMQGLQERKMLVRMSESQPRGADIVKYWEKKNIFSKGNLSFKRQKNTVIEMKTKDGEMIHHAEVI